MGTKAGRQPLDVSGRRFTRLFVTGQTRLDKYNHMQRHCVCDCGAEIWVPATKLVLGRTKSCGCFTKDRIKKHGLHASSEYRVWTSMKSRCLSPTHKQYADYGGRGISICQQWTGSFEAFYKDMGPKPSMRHTLDRINNNGNYEPENCRLATPLERWNNTSRNVFLTVNGKTQTISQWAREVGMSATTVRARFLNGWLPEDVISPVMSAHRRPK